MRAFSSCFRILVVVTSVAIAVDAAQSLLEREANSLVFLQCARELIFGEPSPSPSPSPPSDSVSVAKGIAYDKVDPFCRSPTPEWKVYSDNSRVEECAAEAFVKELVMFKFTQRGGCEVSMNNEDAISEPPCDNPDSVYITDDVFCMGDGRIYTEGQMTDDEDCPSECTEDGFITPRRDGMITILHPNTPPGCCPTSSDPCLSVGNNIPATWCEAFDLCKAFGLVIPNVEAADDAQHVYSLLRAVSSKGEVYRFAWVNIYKDNGGVWRHRASQNPVDESLWGPGELSNPGNCAVATDMANLKPVPCDADYNVMCRGVEDNFPVCTKPLDGFVRM